MLIKLIATAHAARKSMVGDTRSKLINEYSEAHKTRLARLAFLAPDIVSAILDGTQPVTLTSRKLLRATHIPLEWAEQRRFPKLLLKSPHYWQVHLRSGFWGVRDVEYNLRVCPDQNGLLASAECCRRALTDGRCATIYDSKHLVGSHGECRELCGARCTIRTYDLVGYKQHN